jgi:hypothetical protein
LIPAVRDGRYIPHGCELPELVEAAAGGNVTTFTAGGSVTTLEPDEATGVGT